MKKEELNIKVNDHDLSQEEFDQIRFKSVREKAQERVDWINEQFAIYIPFWQKFLLKLTKSKFLARKFGWKAKSYKYDELHEDVIEILCKGKVIVSKRFKV